MRAFLFSLLLLSASFAFTIESYDNHATVLENGDLNIHERMTFVLEKQYNEGYRSIRPADAQSIDDLVINSVEVNGKEVEFYKQVYGGYVEVVWSETSVGTNEVELDYTLKDKVELFDDFARTCYEHFGANWQAPAKSFSSSMTLPEGSRGEEMHFEIYSTKKGDAYVDDLTIVTEIDDVPTGNYVGGCYLFARDSVDTDNVVEGSAYDILESERESYGSEVVLAPFEPFPFAYVCFPLFIILVILTGHRVVTWRKPKYPENILPPGKEDPAFVAALLRNAYPEKDLIAATIIDLINKGKMDIVELEKEGEASAEMKRERTILILKSDKDLRAHEHAVIDMIFSGKKKVDLDKLAEDYKKINNRALATQTHIDEKLDEFKDSIDDILEKKYKVLKYAKRDMKQYLPLVGFVYLWCIIFFGCFLGEALSYYHDVGDMLNFWVLLISLIGIIVFASILIYFAMRPVPPEGHEETFEKWDAFSRAVRSSRIKEYPPSSALVWGEILVYATALGLADKVSRHLSELDALTMKRMQKIQHVATSTYVFYSSANGLRNLSKYGNKSGFRSSSSGGWSSSGGGGFSSRSSGGGGFR